jgi:hypothetical protein
MFTRLTKMKCIFVFAAALLLTAWSGNSQVSLRAGDSYNYQFDTLAFQGNLTFGIAGPSGTVFLYVDPSSPISLGPTNSYKVEMFGDTPAQAPILSRIITAASSIYDTDYRVPDAWGDLQGSIRVTVLSGSITLQGFSFQAIKVGSPVGFDIYGTDRIILPPRPVLSILPSGSKVAVRWPASGTNFLLEATSSLASPVSWSPVTNAVVLSGGMLSATVEAGEARSFFRLEWTGP